MSVVVVGQFTSETQEGLRLAISRADGAPHFASDAEAPAELRDPSQPIPRCVLIDAQSPRAAAVVSALRGEARLFNVPVIMLVRAATDHALVHGHAAGADDVVPLHDLAGVTRRVANLGMFDPHARPPLTQGKALVAHSDMTRRRVLGRLLREAGFDVGFAASGVEAVEAAAGAEPPRLFVVEEGIPPAGAFQMVRDIRTIAAEEPNPTIVLTPGTEVEAATSQAASLGRVSVASALAPADNILFLANELLCSEALQNQRASARLLYGTMCMFRVAGEFEPVAGLTYNISREGMYIRTFDAPKPKLPVWFELRPPGQRTAVHLRASVVWARGLTYGAGGAAPPGFGLRFDEAACPPADLAQYRDAYDTLVRGPVHSGVPAL